MQPDNNQYNFILDPAKNHRSGPAFLQNPKQRNIFAVIFILGILTLVFIVIAIFSSAGGTDVTGLRSVALNQNKILKLSATGLDDARDPSTRSRIATLQAFLTTDFSESKRLLGSNLSENLLAASYDASIDSDLERAAQRNQYDRELLSNLEELVADYKLSLGQSLKIYQSSPDALAAVETAVDNITTYEEPIAATE